MILIVDDKRENVFSLKSILELNGFSTDAAFSGEEALRKILKHDYSLIILDVQMPGMDGFEVAESIGSLNKTRDIPIIFLSAVSTHKRFVTRGFESGAVDYITKPVDPDILILKVRNFYRLYEKTHALKEIEKALKITVSELHSILESLPQVAFTANAAGRIDFVNSNWQRYSAGKDVFPDVHPSDPPLQQQWDAFRLTEEPLELEVRIKELASGQYQYHLLRVKPVMLQAKLVKWVGTFTNIHEQKLLNEILEQRVSERTRELSDANKELEISNHDLQQFASVASHDLKEPLRKIQVFGNLIREREKPAGNLALYVDKIIESSQRMSNLITDLLGYARLSEITPFKPTDLNIIIKGIISDLELLIQEKKAQIHLGLIPDLDTIPGLIRQLFQNIICNSLKFSRPGIPPIVHISAELTAIPDETSPACGNGAFCRINVKDNGIGFEEMYAEKIFILFQRLNSREQYDGTGIGLAIAKKIVDKHNGVITVRSQPGTGSVFTIILPVVQPKNPGETTVQIING
jgi:signal transduction histidine kinase